MLNLNKNKLIPATDIASYLGKIKGYISKKKTDLVELTTYLDTSIKGWVEDKDIFHKIKQKTDNIYF